MPGKPFPGGRHQAQTHLQAQHSALVQEGLDGRSATSADRPEAKPPPIQERQAKKSKRGSAAKSLGRRGPPHRFAAKAPAPVTANLQTMPADCGKTTTKGSRREPGGCPAPDGDLIRCRPARSRGINQTDGQTVGLMDSVRGASLARSCCWTVPYRSDQRGMDPRLGPGRTAQATLRREWVP